MPVWAHSSDNIMLANSAKEVKNILAICERAISIVSNAKTMKFILAICQVTTLNLIEIFS